ncbi:hypothetical protein LTR65_007026 [Meristemomyces frigidus]
MDISSMPYVAKATLGLACVFIVYQAFAQLTTGRQRRALKREKGTLPAPWFSGFRDHILGLDLFRKNMKLIKEHRLLEVVTARFKNDGVRTFRILLLGRQVHFTIEPENLKVIQAVDHKKWGLGSRRKFGFRPLLGDGIFTTDVTMDSATEFLFGESTDSLSKPSSDGFAEAFTRSQDYIGNLARWGKMSYLFPANKEWDHDRKFVHAFVDHYVEKGLAKRTKLLAEKSSSEKPGRYIFIDELVRQTTDRIRIRSELLNILLAGRDTTASLLTNAWFTISKRPDIWAKLQAEVAGLDGELPSFEQLKDMKYLKAVLNESLRLYPVVPTNSREAECDTTLPLGGGPDGSAPLFIEKGGLVAWSVYAMHRRKDYYGEDADDFRPERWLDDPATGKKGLRPGWEYLPFNGGPRICLGQQYALTEASYTTVRLCQAFGEIESRDQQPWTESLTLTCVNLGGAKVALTARDA